jgi:hypothetical protein
MAFGFFKKIKQGLKKAFNFAKDKVIKPIVNTVKPVYDAVKPAISTVGNVVGSSFGVPMAGSIATGIADKGFNVMNAINSGKIRLK